jgi:putative nucleotidyltransferase with HDIG domain
MTHDKNEYLSELEETSERYRALIESTGHFVWSVNIVDFGLVTYNSAMIKYYKEVLGIELRPGLEPKNMLPDHLIEYWYGLYHRVLKDGAIRVPYAMNTSARFLTLSLSPMRVKGEMIGISVFTQDDTELYLAKTAAINESNRYRALIETINDYIFVVSAETYEFELFNTALAEFVKNQFGIDLCMGMKVAEVMPVEFVDFWLAMFVETKRKGVHQFRRHQEKTNQIVNFKLQMLKYQDGTQVISVFGENVTAEERYKEQLVENNMQLRNQFQESINAISKIGELRDLYTAGHQKRVQDLCCAIAREMKLSEEQRQNIRYASIIHDIGKVYLPSELLTKPGKITELEYMMLKTHSQYGYDIVKQMLLPPEVSQMVLQHHECLDGSGYPQGLHGGNILLESQIITVADVVEAISSHRPYRPSLGLEAALREIIIYKGIKYDSKVVDACLLLFSEKEYQFPLE